MDVFCQQCAGKPGWEFKQEYVVMGSCARCMIHRPCNHYVDRKPVHESVVKAKQSQHAPQPKDLVKENVNPHAEVTLPKATGVGMPTPPPVPVVHVHVTEKAAEVVQVEVPAQPEPSPAPVVTAHPAQQPKEGNETDKALAAMELTRPANERGKGVTVEITKKNK